jgi:hypothetical protein
VGRFACAASGSPRNFERPKLNTGAIQDWLGHPDSLDAIPTDPPASF